MSAQRVQIEDEIIKAVRNWPELKLVRDIHIFLNFANFYQRFIKGFNKIAEPLTSMFQTTGLPKNLPSLMDVADSVEVGTIGDGNDYVNKTVERSMSKNSNRATGYLTPKARLAFTQLRKAFTKAPILQHFDSECYI